MCKAFKGAVSPIFEHHCEEQKMHVYRWKSKKNGTVLLTGLFYRIETASKCVWLRVAMI